VAALRPVCSAISTWVSEPKLVTVSSTLSRLRSRSELWEPGAGLAEFTS